MQMPLVRFIVPLAFGACVLSAQAASFDCVAPVFPHFSSTGEGARRVDKQVKSWRKCHAEYRTEQNWVEVARMNAEVEAGFEKWLAATRLYWARQSATAQGMSRLERETGMHSFLGHGETRIDKEERKNAPK